MRVTIETDRLILRNVTPKDSHYEKIDGSVFYDKIKSLLFLF